MFSGLCLLGLEPEELSRPDYGDAVIIHTNSLIDSSPMTFGHYTTYPRGISHMLAFFIVLRCT